MSKSGTRNHSSPCDGAMNLTHGNVFVLSGAIGAGFYAEKILIRGFRIKCSSPMSVDHGV